MILGILLAILLVVKTILHFFSATKKLTVGKQAMILSIVFASITFLVTIAMAATLSQVMQLHEPVSKWDDDFAKCTDSQSQLTEFQKDEFKARLIYSAVMYGVSGVSFFASLAISILHCKGL